LIAEEGGAMKFLAVSGSEVLRAAGLGDAAIAEWIAAEPTGPVDFDGDRRCYSEFWGRSDDLLMRLPKKPRRSLAETAAAEAILDCAREHREGFLRVHGEALYEQLTRNLSRFVRVEDLVFEAATAVPGLTPTRGRISTESDRIQSEKEGIEIDQGIFLTHMLAGKRSGLHLCHAMLLPRRESEELVDKLAREGAVDLGAAHLERSGKATQLTMRNPRYLNAEDATTIDSIEIAVDLAILDPATEIAVLRGGLLDHPRYRGRRVFGSGINLTHLYHGQISFLWFLQRELGFVHKFVRGVARPETLPDDVCGYGIEKPWIAALEGFAIGGHCQLLLAMDYVLAAHDAFMSLPARKEGIIPGLANLRLPRFTGDRIARQLIQHERRLACDSSEGRLICDEIVAADEMDSAIERVVDELANAGAVGAVANRRALRISQEPLDLFRRYCAAYARDQAYCCFSPALIANLERNWTARNKGQPASPLREVVNSSG
jgi:(3,5-dihydroxyphenyl)acetyl-CoA 1,2-dioxygenase